MVSRDRGLTVLIYKVKSGTRGRRGLKSVEKLIFVDLKSDQVGLRGGE